MILINQVIFIDNEPMIKIDNERRSSDMAFIKYLEQDEIPEKNRVDDDDNILQIHGINSNIMKNHFDMYISLTRKHSPLTRVQREEIAVAVSAINGCVY
jgi:alkylhydroperoxidase family enzyme